MKKESFIRWQSITITQLSYVVNLILGLSVASLGFQVNILLGGNIAATNSWQECILIISMFSLLASVALGIFCVINRLLDFRATKEAAKMREENKSEEEIQKYRDLYDTLGKRTWKIFWWQIGFFSLGILLFIIGITPSIVKNLT
ncbi:MAG: hypothetical protein WEA36_02975 [Balneolaceae bacterium]